jgi:uroporphyrinogen decarboxylase
MNDRERFNACMHFEEVDRPPFYEWLHFWQEAVNRWRGEGLPADANHYEYFGFDKREGVGIDYGPIPRYVTKILREDDRTRVTETTGAGLRWVAKSLKSGTSIPQFMEFGIKSPEDFEKVRDRYDPTDMRRYPKSWGPELMEYYEQLDCPVGITFPGLFGNARNLIGLRNLIVMFYRYPDSIKELFDFLADFQVETARKAVEEARLDYAAIWEDMAYHSGPHISPDQWREFMLPGYKKITGFLRRNGIDVIMVDSDGNNDAITPCFLEGGVNCLYPLEVASNEDAVRLRKEYGRKLLLIGNIDKRAVAKGGRTLEEELQNKLPFMLEDGGYFPSVDHCVSSDVSFKNYCRYLELVKSYW